MTRFPQECVDFANAFVELQDARHRADYDPDYRAIRSDVVASIETAAQVIADLRAVPMKDRRALAAWVVFKNRP